MSLDRDELAARFLASLLTKDNGAPRQLADFALECADALLSRLSAPSPVKCEAPESPATYVPTPAKSGAAAYVPQVGDVVALAPNPFVSATDHRDSYGAHLYRVVRAQVDSDGCVECVRVDGRDTTSPCWISPGAMRPASASERAAAGLPVDEAPAFDEANEGHAAWAAHREATSSGAMKPGQWAPYCAGWLARARVAAKGGAK